MRAALLTGVGEPLEIVQDVELAAPRSGEVAVRVSHCGLCHSDLAMVDGVNPVPLPVVLGHEAAGVVEAVGPDVTRLAVGDRVVLTPCPPCGHCYFCVRGDGAVCVDSVSLVSATLPDGTTPLSRGGAPVFRGLNVGAFAEMVVTPENGAVRIPDDVPLDVACVVGCAVQTGVGAVLNTARVEPGATVLVMGLGGVGLAVVQGAVLAGASRIIVSDPVQERRDAALRFGATDLLDPSVDDVVSLARSHTDGIGVDYAFDAAGRSDLVESGLWATRPGGTTVVVGVPPLDDPVRIDPVALFAVTQKRLLGSLLGGCNALRDIPLLMSLYRAGRLDLDAMVTSRRPVEEVNEGLDDLRAARGIRTVLSF